MICNHCNQTIDDTVSYCTYCGAAQKLETPIPVVHPPEMPPVMMYPMPYSLPRPLYYPPKFVTSLIKRLARSPLFSLSILFTLVSTLCAAAGTILDVTMKRTLFDLGTFDFRRIFEAGATGGSYPWLTLVVNSALLFLSFLFIVSLLKMSLAARKPDASLVGGVRLLHSTVIVNFILVCVSASLSTFSTFQRMDSLPGQYTTSSGAFSKNALAVSSLIFGMFLGLLMVSILYGFIIAGFSNIKKSVETGVPNARFVRYVAVMLFIGAGATPISILSQALSLTEASAVVSLLAMVKAVLSGIVSLFMGILLCRYSTAVRTGALPKSNMDIE